MEHSDLQSRRREVKQAWASYFDRAEGVQGPRVRPEILNSWSRSQQHVPVTLDAAPLADEGETASFFHDSPLQVGIERVEEELRRTAEDGDLVIGVTDNQTRVLWTYGGRVMRRKAESVNFVPGGRWDDSSVGTNALDLANRQAAPAMVFSAEHYAPIVHNWVCWAHPLHDPKTGVKLGVIDLSTTWDRSHPIGLATARVLATLIEGAMPSSARRGGEPDRGPRVGDDPARHGRDQARWPAAAAQPAPDRGARAAGAAPRGALAGAVARDALRRCRGHLLHSQG